MANENNLIPFDKMPPSRHRELSRKGAIASNKKQKERKTIVEALKILLQEEVKDDAGKPTGKTYQDLANLGLLKGAMNGKAENYRLLLETIGQLETQNTSTPKIEINVVDNSNLEEVLYDNKE